MTQVQVSLEGKPSDPTPSFPRGQCCTRCYAAKSDAKKCRCRCKGQHHGNAHQKTDMPKWNGVFGDGCNLPIDCVDCDIVECGGRKSERER